MGCSLPTSSGETAGFLNHQQYHLILKQPLGMYKEPVSNGLATYQVVSTARFHLPSTVCHDVFRRCWMFRVPECYLTCSSTCCSCHFKEVLCCECAILALLFCLGSTVDIVWQHRVWEMFPSPTCFLPFRKHQLTMKPMLQNWGSLNSPNRQKQANARFPVFEDFIEPLTTLSPIILEVENTGGIHFSLP